MLLYPKAQMAAHAEIDRVIGRNRLPEIGDRDSLPYVSAIVKEVLRYVEQCCTCRILWDV